MHLPANSLPGASALLLDPASQAVSGQVFGRRIQPIDPFLSYAEKNWTPTDTSGAGLTFTYSTQAVYVKIGKLVVCTADVTYPATADVSLARISLPVPISASGAIFGGTVAAQALTVSTSIGSTLFSSTAGAIMRNVDLSGKRMIFTLSYIAAN